MTEVTVIFPHQLFASHSALRLDVPVYVVEEWLFFRQMPFHRIKLAFHRASMQHYAAELRAQGCQVTYVETHEDAADIRQLIPQLARAGVRKLHLADPTDDWLLRRLRAAAEEQGVELVVSDSPLFLRTDAELHAFFGQKKRLFQAQFYIHQRKTEGILLDADGGPVGGQWSYDADNRKKYPRGQTPPAVAPLLADPVWDEAVAYIHKYFPDNPGELPAIPPYPTTRTGAQQWLMAFLAERFRDFGTYEDAIVRDEAILHHSVLSPLLNVGLLTPREVVDAAASHAAAHDIPLNDLEGFIRQIVGWREFIRAVYLLRGREERTKNHFGFSRPVPAGFWDATTGIPPVDDSIHKVLSTGYCHHIERLMVLGNVLLLIECDPDEVYRWFMALFVDAYDWVMVPNVYGMSQFADGGIFATKPYVSASSYILKMSNHPRGNWQQVWDGLFWRFLATHHGTFRANPRMSMLLKMWEKMDKGKKKSLLDVAEKYLKSLDTQ